MVELPGPAAVAGQGLPYGYLLTPGFDVMPALVEFLKEGGRAYAQPDTFRMNGILYPLGTMFLARGRNPDLDQKSRTRASTLPRSGLYRSHRDRASISGTEGLVS